MTTQFNASHFGAAMAASASAIHAAGDEVVVVLVNKIDDDIPVAPIVQVPSVPVVVANVAANVFVLAQKFSQSCSETLSSTVNRGVPEQMYPEGGS